MTDFNEDVTSGVLYSYPINIINPSTVGKGTVIPDSTLPYVVRQGIHSGELNGYNYIQGSMRGTTGTGLNPYGFYSLSFSEFESDPTFLVSAKSFNNPFWGSVLQGELRVGDNVKEDNGSLVGANWLWYKPGKGLEVSGPILQSTSSDINVIQSPGFDNTTEFDTSGSVTHESGTGYTGDSYNFTGSGYIQVKGYKTVDGATTLRGSVLYNASSDFDGTLKVLAETFDSDKNSLGISSSIINVVSFEEWNRFNFVLRLDNADTFVLFLQVTNQTVGSILVDNWSAYKVFQSGISTFAIPETLQPPKKGVVIDATGIRGYWGNKDEELQKNFELSAADGNAFLRGNLLVNGTVHSGYLYKEDNTILEEFNWLKVKYLNGTGINEYGVYGVNAVTNPGSGDHISSCAKFFLGAKTAITTNSSYWGDAVTAGELRVGTGVIYDSGNHRLLNEERTDEADAYLWFFPGNTNYAASLNIKGNINLGGGHYVWVGVSPEVAQAQGIDIEGCGIGDAGITGFHDNIPRFILSAADINDSFYNTVEGEFRVGTDVRIDTSDPTNNTLRGSSYFWFRPGQDLQIVLDGVTDTVKLGDKLTWINNLLHVSGSMSVDGYVHTGTLYDENNVDGCGLNEYGVYGCNSNVGKFLVTAKSFTGTTVWGDSNQGEFRVGDNVKKTSSTTLAGSKYIWFDGSDFRLKGVNLELSSGNYIWVGTPTTDGAGLSEYGIAGSVSSSPKFLLAAKTIPDGTAGWYGVNIGDFRLGSNVLTLAGTSLEFDSSSSALNLLGNLNLLEDTSYVRLGSSTTGVINTGYLSSNALAFYGDTSDQVNILLGTGAHSWLSETEFRIGSNVQDLGSGTDLRYSKSTGLTLRQNLTVTNGSAVITTDGSGNFAALNTTGFASGNGTNYTFLVSNTGMSGTGISVPLVPGEFRAGSDVGDLTGDYLRYEPGVGIHISSNGVVSGPSSTVLGDGANVTLGSLSLTGHLDLSSTTYTGNIPDSYIGISAKTYISGGGVAIGGSSSWQAMLLSDDHPAVSTGDSLFYVGQSWNLAGSPTGKHIYWDGTNFTVNAGNFSLDYSGNVTATNASISGDITATSGSFTGAIYATSGTLGNLSITGALTLQIGSSTASLISGDVWVNEYGISGGDSSTAQKHFVLSAKTVSNNSVWGNLVPGEFRIGTDVRDTNFDNVLENESNMLWYKPGAHFKLRINGANLTLSDKSDNVSSLIDLAGTTANWSGIPDAPTVLPDTVGPSNILVYDGTHLGSHDGTSWMSYLSYNGDFYLTGNGSGGYLQWDHSANSLTVKGDIQATSGAIKGTLTVGTANQIQIVGGTSTPYIQSSNYYLNGQSSTGWKIGYDGVIRASSLQGVDNYLVLGSEYGSSNYARINTFATSSISLIDLRVEGGSGLSQFRLSQDVGITMSAIGSTNSIDIGQQITPTINIKPSSTGVVNIGYPTTASGSGPLIDVDPNFGATLRNMNSGHTDGFIRVDVSGNLILQPKDRQYVYVGRHSTGTVNAWATYIAAINTISLTSPYVIVGSSTYGHYLGFFGATGSPKRNTVVQWIDHEAEVAGSTYSQTYSQNLRDDVDQIYNTLGDLIKDLAAYNLISYSGS